MKKKTIFSIMTLGLVTLLGFGFLGGLIYQPKEAKASEITTHLTKKYRDISISDNYYDKDVLIYFVAKNYENNGNGTFYYGEHIGIDTSAVMPTFTSGTFNAVSSEISLLNGNNVLQTNISFKGELYQGVSTLTDVYLQSSEGINTIYHVNNTQPPSGLFFRTNCAFLATRISNSNNKEALFLCLNTFFNAYEISSDYFIFDNFNPYYLWNVNYKENPYVNYSSDIGYAHNIKVEPFYVAGVVFDTIRINYADANNKHFKIDNRYITTDFSSSGNYVYFDDMGYVNSATNYYLPILRQEVIYGTNNYEGITINVGSLVWVSDEYKTLQFFEKPSTNTINKLYALTNISQRAEFVTYNDVGLGNAFALISQAFTAWLPILSIAVIPGISLGMLIFLPLIAGIIIFIIWIVKR